uniref:Uncharacterized protein n=1 Tax=uncultured microorganism TaxID=358574 RepID=I2FJI9_9ZZZZ|nr:hypothetical protein [uncultured microorganism]
MIGINESWFPTARSFLTMPGAAITMKISLHSRGELASIRMPRGTYLMPFFLILTTPLMPCLTLPTQIFILKRDSNVFEHSSSRGASLPCGLTMPLRRDFWPFCPVCLMKLKGMSLSLKIQSRATQRRMAYTSQRLRNVLSRNDSVTAEG